MPKYRVTAPDGRVFEVTAPEGATQEQALAYAQQHAGPWTKYQQAEGPWTRYQQAEGAGPLKAFRQQYPQYDNFSDADLADRLHAKFYGDMPRAEFDQRIGLAGDPANVAAQRTKVKRVQFPDGNVRRIEAPEGATDDEVLAYARIQYQPEDPREELTALRRLAELEAKAAQSRPDPSHGQRMQAGHPGGELGRIEQALRAADAAGNTGDARRLAQAYADTRRRQAKPDFSNVRGGVESRQRIRPPVPYHGPLLADSKAVQAGRPAPTLAQTNAANRATREAPGYAADQARIAAENRRTEFKALPAPLRFGIGFGGRIDTMGRGIGQLAAMAADKVAPRSHSMSDLVTGRDPSRYAQAMQDEAAARQRDAYMDGDVAATLGGITGDVALTFAPGGAAARLGGMRGVLASGALSGAYGGLQPVVEGESRTANAGTGAAFGAGGQLVGAGLSRWGQNAARAVPEDVRAMTRKATELGIPVHASQVSQSLPVKVAASAGKYLPFSGYAKAAQSQQTGINRAIAKTFGAEADKLTDDVMHSARRRLNAGFEDVYGRNAVPISEQGARKLAQVEQQAMRRLTRDDGQVLRNQLDDILANAEDGVLTGQKYQAVRSELMKAEGPDKLGQSVKELRKALDDIAAESVGPKDAAKLKELRSQWANFRTVESALKQNAGAGGDIRLSALWPLIRKGSTKEMRDLARMGQTVLKDPISDSGTAQRTLAYNVLMGGGSLANPALIPMFAKASLGGATVGRLANSSGLARLLARENRGAGASRLGGLLEGAYPYVAPALTQYSIQGGQ